MNGFEKKLHAALDARDIDRLKKINESVRPTPGIWYYIYFEPDWKLITYRADEYDNLSHLEAWSNYILPDLVKFYGLEKEERAEIEDLYRGFPRGRIDVNTSPEHIDMSSIGMFTAFHGGDYPSNLNKSSEEGKILNIFNLNQLMVRNLVKFDFHVHETMIDEHRKVMLSVIGDIPY